jgi:hypothetical protein
MEFRHEVNRSLWDYWNNKRPAGKIPTESDFDLLDLAPLLPRIFMVKPSEHNEPVYHYSGRQLADFAGVDLTGDRATKLVPREEHEAVAEFLTEVIEGPAIGRIERFVRSKNGRKIWIEMSFLPFGDSERATGLFGSMTALEPFIGEEKLDANHQGVITERHLQEIT